MALNLQECSIEELHPELAKLVQPLLISGDNILVCYEMVEETQGLFRTTINGATFIITQSRFIAAAIENQTKVAGSLQLTDIVSVNEAVLPSQRDKTLVYWVNVYDKQDEERSAVFRSQVQAQKFVQILRTAIEQAKATTSPAVQPLPNPEERLRRLTQLHNDSLISEEEFQQKRREILGEL